MYLELLDNIKTYIFKRKAEGEWREESPRTV